MASPSPEPGTSCAVAGEDQPDVAAVWPSEASRWVRRARWDGRRLAAEDVVDASAQSAQTMCRVLDKLGESDSDNVHRWTDVGGMVSNSGGWGPVSRETRRELTEACSRSSSSDRRDANAYVVNCARAIASISASSPGETPALSPATRMTEYLLFSAWQNQHLSARRGWCGEHRPSVRRPTADRWVPPAKLGTLHERCACAGEVSRETSSESLKDRSRSDLAGGSNANARRVHIGVRERDTQTPSPGNYRPSVER